MLGWNLEPTPRQASSQTSSRVSLIMPSKYRTQRGKVPPVSMSSHSSPARRSSRSYRFSLRGKTCAFAATIHLSSTPWVRSGSTAFTSPSMPACSPRSSKASPKRRLPWHPRRAGPACCRTPWLPKASAPPGARSLSSSSGATSGRRRPHHTATTCCRTSSPPLPQHAPSSSSQSSRAMPWRRRSTSRWAGWSSGCWSIARTRSGQGSRMNCCRMPPAFAGTPSETLSRSSSWSTAAPRQGVP
mmetsp:Transcript_17596/g.44574  ORF Transcript_17596/g.44574 Transcript_17596/m.44574 type:complete len:243 (-) Transcript_17596:550-1278(-)